jgi:hypothetical protein
MKKFYKSANAILRVEGQSRELTMLRLVESHCVSILTYAIEVQHLSTQEMRKMRVAYCLERFLASVDSTVCMSYNYKGF